MIDEDEDEDEAWPLLPMFVSVALVVDGALTVSEAQSR